VTPGTATERPAASVTNEGTARFADAVARFTQRRPNSVALFVGLCIAVAVCYPFFRPGSLYLLDWVVGPHVGTITAQTLGLSGGLTVNTPSVTIEALLFHLIHGPATWLPLAAFFPLAAYSMSRLVGGSLWCRVGAATLYAVNPFVFNRVFVGHIPLLIGYALLPLATRSALTARSAGRLGALAPALWWAVLTALSVHFCWIYGVVMVVVACSSRREIVRGVRWLAINLAAFAISCAYLVLPQFGTSLPLTISQGSLANFRTAADPHLGLLTNVIGLYGFWRAGPGPVLPKNDLSGWPLILLALVLIAAAGAYAMVVSRRDDLEDDLRPRRMAGVLLAIGALGILLAMGDQGPTGGLFRLAYDHVPFFNIMREPEKFLMLYAMAFAVFFGRGVQALMERSTNYRRASQCAIGVLLCIGLPLSYTPTIFGGLDGQIALSQLPSSWAKADALMGAGAGKILALPWHQYLEYSFTDDRVIANAAQSSFTRDVIAGDNLQVAQFETNSTSPQSKYLQTLFNDGEQLKDFGALVAPLGVQYVVLAKTADWSSYKWLTQQKDLHLVMTTKSLDVWRNSNFQGVGGRYRSLKPTSSVTQLETIAAGTHRSLAPFVLSKTVRTGTTGQRRSAVVTQVSPVEFDVASGAPGWVALDAPFERGWSGGSTKIRASIEGDVLVKVSGERTAIDFSPWHLVRVGYAVSAFWILLLMLLCGAEALSRRRRTEGSPRAPDSV
jgi:hypothetical protein